MDNQRLFLFIAISLVVMLMWDAWQREFSEPVPAPQPSTVQQLPTETPAAAAVPDQSIPSADGIPTTAPTATMESSSDTPVPDKPAAEQAQITTGQRVTVRTDLLELVIDTAGGDVRRVDLLTHPVSTESPDEPVRLLNDVLPDLYIAQSGLISGQSPAPDHHAIFSVPATSYELKAGENEIIVPLTWTHESGVQVVKKFILKRNSYLIDLDVEVKNTSANTWSGRLYRQLQRTKIAEKGQSTFIYTYMGGVFSSSYNKYEKVQFDEMAEWKPKESYVTGGWTAMLQHYFLGAWIPPANEPNHYYSKAIGGERYIVGLTSQEQSVAPGQSANMSTHLYVGPKAQGRLKEIAENLDLTVDYGFLTIIAQPLYWILSWLYGILGNWGWSIVVLTFMIKLVFYKLSEASYKSMARMRKFQPKIAALKERYGSDKQRMSQAMMELYKKEKINPLGGCLPILVQIPVFIALYWVLLESVELRQADFILWINDLSAKDPFYVLPVLMGISMFVQQKLNPAPMEPIQQKILMALPFVFTLFFMVFPSGLVLYWVVNNLLSIAQQWYITRKIEQAA